MIPFVFCIVGEVKIENSDERLRPDYSQSEVVEKAINFSRPHKPRCKKPSSSLLPLLLLPVRISFSRYISGSGQARPLSQLSYYSSCT